MSWICAKQTTFFDYPRLCRMFSDKLPLFLTIILYALILFVRYQQGGWEVEIDLFKSLRQALDQKINQFLPSPQAELLSGILLGNKKDLPGDLRLALRDSSTLHIVVASGQNLSILAGFFLGLLGLIRVRTALLLSLLAVIFYTLLTGVQVPILRAAIMFSLASFATLYGRQREGFWVLLLAAGLMLLVNPKWLGDLSFQLSFFATFGVVVVSPVLLRYFKFMPIIGQDLAVTLSAQVMVMPLIAQNFHQVSLVALFSNILVLWTIPFIMVGGILMLILSMVSSTLGQIIGAGINILLTYFIYIVKFFSSLPFAWEYIGQQAWMIWVGYYMVVASIMILLNSKDIERS